MSDIGSERKLSAEFLKFLLQLVVMYLQGGTVYHIFLMLTFGGEASYNIFHEVGLSVTNFFLESTIRSW